MKLPLIPALLLLLLLLQATAVSAFPTGAGQCPADMAAVSGAHLRDGAITGSLADGGVTFTIGDTVMAPGDRFETSPLEEFNVTLLAASDNMPIRGFLVRLECSTDLTGAITSEDPLVQEAAACAQDDNFVVGLTHNSNVDKQEIAMTIVLDTPTTVTVDVTVVMMNGDNGSMYYYDKFIYSASYPACDICGGAGALGNPEGIIKIPADTFPGLELTEIDCATANDIGTGGQIPPDLCPLTPALAGPVCLCGGGGEGGGETEGTEAPTTTEGTDGTAAPSSVDEVATDPPAGIEVDPPGSDDGASASWQPAVMMAMLVLATAGVPWM
jgi:hypothetical protein